MKKLLIWDADECLWDGTIVSGATYISHERIRVVRELMDRGVLQSIASQNHEKDVLAMIRKYEMEDCFLCIQAHFEVPKSVMVKIIMEDLGISRSTDVVYLDDQAFNLAEVESALPGVVCMYPYNLHTVMDSFFTKNAYNTDDRSRVRRYRTEQDRKRAAVDYRGDYLDFLRACDMKVSIRPPEEHEMDRVIDLVERANQMSIVGVDFTNDQLREIRPELVGCWCWDKYGDNGLVGVACCVRETIPMFVVSCRMQGKGIGSYLLGSIINTHPGKRLRVLWKGTEYNGPMRELLAYHGFVEPETEQELRIHLHIREGDTAQVVLPDWIESV